MTSPAMVESETAELCRSLSERHGPLMSGNDLMRALGFKSGASFRRAIDAKALELPTFQMQGRRGQFGLSKDVAKWLIEQRNRGEPDAVKPAKSSPAKGDASQ